VPEFAQGATDSPYEQEQEEEEILF
jgi:hypothetical protein